jgi:formate dehydrogenase subunit beta
VELVKHNQARLENIVIIGMDCLGTFDPVDYRELCESGGDRTGEWMAASGGGKYLEDLRRKSIRRTCSACGHIEAEHAAIHLSWVGMGGTHILVSVTGEYIDWASSFLGEGSELVPKDRLKSMEAIRSRRDDNKRLLYEEFSAHTGSVEWLLAELAGCIKCHNCRQACPLCFCRECVFSTEIFKHDPEYYLNRADRKGLMGMPANKLLFQLTRINHMGLGCVGCGQCESACPAKIPVAMLFKIAGERMQQVFDYVPGRSLEEDPPLTNYKESELEPR